jgi:integrase/recombinase XerD
MPKKGDIKQRAPLGDLSDPQGFAAMSEEFFTSMKVTNYAESTIRNRYVYLRYFVAWCEKRQITRPAEVTRAVLERYQRYLYHYRKDNGDPLSFRSQGLRLSSLKAFFSYLAKRHMILYNPSSEIELPKQEKRLPRNVMTRKEAETVLNVPDIGEPLGIRDRAMLEVVYCTGMRRMELSGLKLYDIDAERGTIMIRKGKGRKDRMVPLSERALAWIERYVAQVRPELVIDPDDGTLFLTSIGQGFGLTRITQLVRNYVAAARIGKQGSCHMFRHTIATLMLENGADVRVIQQLLGHAKLETTQIYTQVSIRMLKRVHDQTHPAAKLKRNKAKEELTP